MTTVTRRRVYCYLPNQPTALLVVDENGHFPLEHFVATGENYKGLSGEKLAEELKACDSYGEQMMSQGEVINSWYMSCFQCPFHKDYHGEDATFTVDQEKVVDAVETLSLYPDPELMDILSKTAEIRRKHSSKHTS